jgi:hypothetical protein
MPETWFNFEIDTLYLDRCSPILDTVGYTEYLPDDLRQVRKLAVFHNSEWLQARNLDTVLSRFGHVKSLNIAVRRLDGDIDHSAIAKYDDLVLMDVLNFDAALEMIQNPDEIHDNTYSQLGKLYTARVCHSGMDVAEEQKLKVPRASNSMGNSQESPKYTMPWIQRRIITTCQVKLCYDQAMAEHHKIRCATRVQRNRKWS